MTSLSRSVLLASVLILAGIGLLGGVIIVNIQQLGAATRRLAEEVLAEEQALHQFQEALDRVVITAGSYARTRQPGTLADAQATLDTARALLPTLEQLAAGQGAAQAQQAERAQLVDEAAQQLDDLEGAVRSVDTQRTGLLLRRLDQLSQTSATLARASNARLIQVKDQAVRDARRIYQQVLVSTAGIFGLLAAVAVVLVGFVRRQIIRPLGDLLGAVNRAGEGELDQQVTVGFRHEIGQLQAGFNTMLTRLRQQRQAIQDRSSALEAASERQTKLLATVSALDAPVLPVLDGVLALPIVGFVDDQRIEQLSKTLLATVYSQGAEIVILDLTGLAAVDAAIMERLLQLIHATKLLGTQVYVVGISPSFARLIAEQNQALDLTIFQSLREAIELIVQRQVRR